MGDWSDQFQLPPLVGGITFIGPFPMANNRFAGAGRWHCHPRRTFRAAALSPLWPRACVRYFRIAMQRRCAASTCKASYRLSFVLGNAVIFAGGILFALAYSFDLTVAWTMSITAFAIMIIGGPGSVLGALIIGMVFGLHPGGGQHRGQPDDRRLLLSRRDAADPAF